MTALDTVKAFNELLWNHFLMYALLGVGIFYTVYLGFPQIRHLNLAFKYAFGPVFKKKKPGENKVSSFQALATAVAAQVGTGNIGGVATAIATGGMGAIFWMWLSALLGMSTIFSEAVLAQKYKKEYHGETVGGSAYYLYYGLGSKWLAVFFSIAIVFALGCVGNMVQANSISIALTNAFHISPYIVGFVLAAVVAVVIIGGQRRITSLAELLVPFMAVVYIIGSLVIIFMFADYLPYVFRTIFHDAFSMEAAGGGAAGTVMKYAIRYGVARGLFSNEAGMGSTPHAHALADVKDPSEQGFVAMAGVFVDTVLICSSTAFVIMLTGSFENTALKSVAITQAGFETAFGESGIIFLAVSLLFFAFTTIIGWYMFAEMNIKFMFGKKGVKPFRGVAVGCIFIGCLFAADIVWELADTFNGLMVIPNLVGIVLLAPQVKKIYRNFLARRKAKA
ncbi:MAG: alanine/glycine:cation symporter family protein [Prevotella multiformis]|uniref:alanine/glycine:cation symporter family protein n=1 Tax=Prevotella multiformis TaxID=282402 RepID=UPI003F9EFFAC